MLSIVMVYKQYVLGTICKCLKAKGFHSTYLSLPPSFFFLKDIHSKTLIDHHQLYIFDQMGNPCKRGINHYTNLVASLLKMMMLFS